MRFFGSALTVCLLLSTVATAAPIVISGYDINDAVLSGHGAWSHTYTGTITAGATFINETFPGTAATYSGVGGGTLTDGIIANSASDSQLFINGTTSDGTLTLRPAIFLTLPFASVVRTIDLFGGPTNNFIPGAITGVTVGLLDTNFNLQTLALSTIAFGPTGPGGTPVNDRVRLAGTSLDGIPAFAVFLSNFEGEVFNWISLTEIQLDDEDLGSGVVPEPSTFVLAGGALALAGLLRRKR